MSTLCHPASSGVTAEEWATVVAPCFGRYRRWAATQDLSEGTRSEAESVDDAVRALRCFYPYTQDAIERGGARAFSGLIAAVAGYHRHTYVKPQQLRGASGSEAAAVESSTAWFLRDLLPAIVRWAEAFPKTFGDAHGQPHHSLDLGGETLVPVYALPFLPTVSRKTAGDRSVTMARLTRRQCLSVLSLTILGLGPRCFAMSESSLRAASMLHDNFDVGVIDWWLLINGGLGGVGPQRLMCQLKYFDTWRWAETPAVDAPHPAMLPAAGSIDDSVTFYRAALTPTRPEPDLAALRDVPIVHPEAQHVFDTRYIEQHPDADAHFDFANRQIMIGQIIPSCTQEEVMFSIRPELFLALPLYSTLLARETAGVAGTSAYTGYQKTFQFAGDVALNGSHPLSQRPSNPARASPRLPFIVIADAHVNDGREFGSPMNTRDMLKAYVSFDLAAEVSGAHVLATGPWGCGVFRGNVYLKLLQQLMAVACSDWAAAERRGSDGGDVDASSGDDDSSGTPIHLRYHTMQGPLFTGLVGLLRLLGTPLRQPLLWINEYGSRRNGVEYSLDRVIKAIDEVRPLPGETYASESSKGTEAGSVAFYWALVLEGLDETGSPPWAFETMLAVKLGEAVRSHVLRVAAGSP
jgi:hypothetical protein